MAFRSCADCRSYIYDEKTGRRAEHGGKPVARPKGTFPPCHYGPEKCPKGNPDAGRELTAQNLEAWQHYQECRAVGQFPADEIVRRNAAIISQVVEGHDRAERRAMQQAMLAVLGIRSAL